MPSPFSTHVKNPLVDQNEFRTMTPDSSPLPSFETAQCRLPRPFWEGHESAVNCYFKAWEIAFRYLRTPTVQNGFVANYIDTAFNDHLFMWDSSFISFFGRYGANVFDFQRTLDNLYAKQHPDGFICREIIEADGSDMFERFDPCSTGPNVLSWAEWEHFCTFRDKTRLARVLPVLIAYHEWLRSYRTWPDGGYWSSGWASGMDNQPRQVGSYHRGWHHGFMTWADACFQQILSAKSLLRMNEVLGSPFPMRAFVEEVDRLGRLVETKLWDPETCFYYDLGADGARTRVKTIGAYWALLADAVSGDRIRSFLEHLSNQDEFCRAHRVPSLSHDHPEYESDGGYWMGGVWAPTNYMVLRGLTRTGRDALAFEIGRNHHANVVKVFESTGTLWENYAPESAAPGRPAKADFVGWTGLSAIAMLLEYVFGLRANPPRSRLVWDVQLLEAHGVNRFPFGPAGVIDLSCDARSSSTQPPSVDIRSNVPFELELRWGQGRAERRLIEPRGVGKPLASTIR
jgi:hypothetical protein